MQYLSNTSSARWHTTPIYSTGQWLSMKCSIRIFYGAYSTGINLNVSDIAKNMSLELSFEIFSLKKGDNLTNICNKGFFFV